MNAPIAPRRAVDVPGRVHPRRAVPVEATRFPVRRLLVGVAVAVGMIGGGVAVPFVAPAQGTPPDTLAAAPGEQPAATALPEDGSTPSISDTDPSETAVPMYDRSQITVQRTSFDRMTTSISTVAEVAQEYAVVTERERASRAAKRPARVVGIPSPCEVDAAFPENASMGEITAAMEQRWNLKLVGNGWSDPSYRPVIKVLWQTLDAVDCTPYLATISGKVNGPITINAGRIRGYAWGDWGLTKPGVMSLDFAKMSTGYANGDITRIARVLIHELGHVYNVDRGASPQYWKTFQQLYGKHGSVADYDRGRDRTETYAESIAQYVVRCTDDNPYNKPGNAEYYDFIRQNVFGGREFGPTSGTAPVCN